MTTQHMERCLVMALAVALLTGRADGQQKPADNPPEKKADARPPRGDGKGPRDDVPGDPNRRRPGEPVDPAGRPADGFRPYDRPSAEVPRRPGGRGPEGPGLYGPPMMRDGRPPREGSGYGPPGGGFFPGMAPEDRMRSLKETDPEMYELESKDQELERQTEELAQQLRRTPRDQRDSLKKQLQELVQKHFDARQARRDLQLKRLETELERMRESMKKRVEMREQIIGKRIAELAGEHNEFDF